MVFGKPKNRLKDFMNTTTLTTKEIVNALTRVIGFNKGNLKTLNVSNETIENLKVDGLLEVHPLGHIMVSKLGMNTIDSHFSK